MSYERGWEALNLNMPDSIPHTEYCSHPALVKEITGTDPRKDNSAWREFYKQTGYDFLWFTNDGPLWKGRTTSMGHAEFEQNGSDYDDNVNCPFKSAEEALELVPEEEYGIPEIKKRAVFFEKEYKQRVKEYPFLVNPGGYYKTLFSACIDVFGWDMFLTAAGSDYDRFDKVLEGFFKISYANFCAWAETSISVFICHDDIVWSSGPVFHPGWYRKYIFPRYKKLWTVLKEAGIKILFCADGDYTMFINDIAEAGADGFIFEPMTDLETVVRNYGKSKVIIGNIDTRILTFGNKEDIKLEVERCAGYGRECPGYFFAVGNHIPHNVPVDNVLYYFELIEKLGKR